MSAGLANISVTTGRKQTFLIFTGMKVRKIHPDEIWKERRDAFLELTPGQRLEWLQTMQDRMRKDENVDRPLKLRVIRKGGPLK